MDAKDPSTRRWIFLNIKKKKSMVFPLHFGHAGVSSPLPFSAARYLEVFDIAAYGILIAVLM